MSELVWTRDKPQIEGWYWYRESERYSGYIVEVLRLEIGIVMVKGFYDSMPQRLQNYVGWWAGPLPEPKEDTEDERKA